MKNIISFFIQSTVVFTLLMLSSCGSALDPVDPNRCDELQTKAQVFIDAAVLYGQDPSDENCKSYRTATEDYLEIIKDCGALAVNGVEETEAALEDLDC